MKKTFTVKMPVPTPSTADAWVNEPTADGRRRSEKSTRRLPR
jgi:hypothetical protein